MKAKKTMKGGETKPLSKLEVLDKYPKIAAALQDFVAERQAGSGRRMMGSGWWDDFVSWLKENKVISTASKIGASIATAFGNVPIAAALSAASAGASTLGYGYVNNLSKIGTKMKGKGVVKDFVKKHRLVSRGLEGLASIVPQGSDAMNTQGAKNTLYRFANAAKVAGYGYGYSDAQAVARGVLKMTADGMGNMKGKGPVYSQNGMLVKQPKQSGGCGCGMMGGATTQYNTVSTEFSEVKFR
jgi:hypothetical protein